MSSPAVRSNSGVPRKLEIPSSLILNWQSSALHGAKPKPLNRRPKTACERCRNAKVRCHGDGQHDCDRCTGRGLSCRYRQPAPSPTSTASPRRRPGPSEHATPEQTQMDMSAGPADHFTADDAAFQQLLDASVGWPNMNDIHPPDGAEPQHMDWGPVDPVLDWSSGTSPSTGLNLSTILPTASVTLSSTSAPTAAATTTTTTITTDSTPASEHGNPLSNLGLFPLISCANAGDLCWEDQLGSQNCQCRSGLPQLIPKARTALQEGRLDAVFQVTSDAIRLCQSIVKCNSCAANCTDLICIMTVFQEADPCFDYIAKGGIDKPITISMGSYEMAVDEPDAKQWRRMLVIQLLRRANELLDLISGKGQDMLKSLDPGCRLGRVNIDYLEAVIGNTRDNFQNIMKGFRDEARVAL